MRSSRAVTAWAAAAALGLAGCDRDGPAGSSPLDAPLERPEPGDRVHAAALIEAGRSAAAAGNFEAASDRFSAAVSADPASVEGHLELGFVRLERLAVTDYGAALTDFRLAGLLDPGNPFAACGEGIARQQLGDLDHAEPLLRAALAAESLRKSGDACMFALAALARIEAVRGHAETALALYAEAAALPTAPAAARAVYAALRAELLDEQGDAAAAEKESRIAIERDPKNLRAHHQLARLLARRGATAEAAIEAKRHELLRQLADHTTPRYAKDKTRRVALWQELAAAWPEWSGAKEELARAQAEVDDNR